MPSPDTYLLADAHPNSPIVSVANYVYEERAIPMQLAGLDRAAWTGHALSVSPRKRLIPISTA